MQSLTPLMPAKAGIQTSGERIWRRFHSPHHSSLRPSSRAHSRHSVLGFPFLRRHSLCRQVPGSSPQHVRWRRHRFLAQNRNDPNRSHCARYTRSVRLRNGTASHSSRVSRPGKLRLPPCTYSPPAKHCPCRAPKGGRAQAPTPAPPSPRARGEVKVQASSFSRCRFIRACHASPRQIQAKPVFAS